MKKIEQYSIFEATIQSPAPHNSHVDVDFYGIFLKDGQETGGIRIKGFYAGNGDYKIRFMPKEEGLWHFTLYLNSPDRVTESGTFECIRATGLNHGAVKPAGTDFVYDDGTKFVPYGTTIYAWIHQTDEIVKETVETLRESPFNKVRMCVFPKHAIYNSNDPQLYPFEKNDAGAWDVNKPSFSYWDHLEKCLNDLLSLGIETDLILFHPYDRWGFSKLSLSENLVYLDYLLRRLSAYRNIWWSLANEYDMVFTKTNEDWLTIGQYVSSNDPYNHLLSIHNWLRVFDPKTPWISHLSLQTNIYEKVLNLVMDYKKPVILDEVRYEGDIEPDWGNISAFELTHRFWAVMMLGGYCSHGETFYREDEVLWWAKGGKLYGESPKRIAFLKSLLCEVGGTPKPNLRIPVQDPNNLPGKAAPENPYAKAVASLTTSEREQLIIGHLNYTATIGDDYTLYYLGKECRAFLDLELPENDTGCYVEVIDIWEMSRTAIERSARGKLRVKLPGKEGMAVLVQKLKDYPHYSFPKGYFTMDNTMEEALNNPAAKVIMEKYFSSFFSLPQFEMALKMPLGAFCKYSGGRISVKTCNTVSRELNEVPL
ncbi:MAG TPA: DUF4038 domain-containing protein [Clostridiales bacterium]|nr:DUF4038 domain-containing protein [Clostridiales bacterium]